MDMEQEAGVDKVERGMERASYKIKTLRKLHNEKENIKAKISFSTQPNSDCCSPPTRAC